ncbi:uncharacterized protein LOC143259788 [Megalopta genalis]|uniref:uncharacterized protein LOC143259788 n=1 Tax=Megalopta genalis TaxID=115081 RepID=UPI003FD41FA0
MLRKRKKIPDGSGSITPEEDDDIIDDESKKQDPDTSTVGSVIPATMESRPAVPGSLKLAERFEDLPLNQRSEPATPSRRDSQLWKFLSTDRSTRRNAITDLCSYSETGILELPERFEDLSVGIGQSNNGTQDSNTPSTSKQQG